MTMPTLKLKYRHDAAKECVNLYSENCLALQDVTSTLEMALNSNQETAQGYSATDVSDASNIVVASRWGNTYMPIDVTGFLERGEEFYFEYKKDQFGTDDVNITTADSANNNSANYGTLVDLPSDGEDHKFTLQYLNTLNVDADWVDVTSETRFSYECHDKSSNMNGARNTHGDFSSSTKFTNTSSSNVKGAPKFRLCLPSQSTLLQIYQSSQPNAGNNELFNFGSLKRHLELNLKYSKSAQLEKLNGSWSKDIDGNDKTLKLDVYVKSDAYAANIKYQSISYQQKYNGLVKTMGTVSTIDEINFEDSAQIGNFKAVGYKVKSVPGSENQLEPDYTGLQAYDLSEQHYGEKDTTVSFVDAQVDENRYGSQAPIAIISVDNYETSFGYSASAKVVPLFQRAEDEADWELNNNVFCKLDNTFEVSTDASSGSQRLIPANNNYSVSLLDNGTKISLHRNTPLNYEQWIGTNGDIVNGHNFKDSATKAAYSELVVVKVTYHEPNSLFGVRGQRKDKTLIIRVTPKDIREIAWDSTFEYVVNDGDKEVDISSLLTKRIYYIQLCLYIIRKCNVYIIHIVETSCLSTRQPFIRIFSDC
jgi:hypothetical protein